MIVTHISDLHGKQDELQIPASDLLITTGDYGPGRTNLADMIRFIEWLHKQPARKKVFIAGNHDIPLSRTLPPEFNTDSVARKLHLDQWHAVMANIIQFPDIKYLEDETYVWEGLTIYGMPWSPEFHPERWAFNANEQQMTKHLAKIPSEVDILLSHGPAYGYMDLIPQEYAQPKEDLHRGCKKTLEVMQKRLKKLKLFAFGHIHESVTANRTGCDNYGIRMVRITNTRSVLFSNGAVVDNDYKVVNRKPLSINL